MDISHIMFWELIKDWIWLPLVTVITSALGFHIKAEREARQKIYERIEDEHLRVEDNYVRKDTLEALVKQIESIAENVEYIRRNGIKEDA